ncbi:MAG: hypothetical protein JWR69_4784, partial [Pedosphaera sp.]|nr:hypothetical protein [Pedosphaera sp.]
MRRLSDQHSNVLKAYANISFIPEPPRVTTADGFVKWPDRFRGSNSGLPLDDAQQRSSHRLR